MSKTGIAVDLRKRYKEFAAKVDELSNEDFMYSYNGKWTAGQQLEHICRSVNPLIMILGFPKYLIRISFGRANRPSRTYDDLVKRYRSKLENGGIATGRFLPKPVTHNQKKVLISGLLKLIEKLIKRIDKFSEKELNEYILPHPLLGKITLNEMLFFTMYHVEHHQNLMLNYLTKKGN